jgi:hypothetical protein
VDRRGSASQRGGRHIFVVDPAAIRRSAEVLEAVIDLAPAFFSLPASLQSTTTTT